MSLKRPSEIEIDSNNKSKIKKLGLTESDTEPLSTDVIINFQKAAIYRQLIEYKRLYESSLEDISVLKGSKQSLMNTNSKLLELWNLMIQDLQILSNSFPPGTCIIPDHAFIKSISDSMTQDLTVSKYTKLVSDLFALLISKLNDGISPQDPTPILQARYHNAKKSIISLEHQLQESNSKNAQLDTQISNISEQLTRAQKKYDRLKMSMDLQSKELEESNQVTINKSVSEESLTSVGASAASDANQKKLIHEINELTTLNQLKLSQIQQLESEKIKLTQDLEKLKYNSEPRDSELIQQLQSKLEYKQSEIQVLKESNEQLLKEKLDLEASRKSFMTLVSQQEEQKRKTLEGEMKKIEADLIRIRKARESIKTSLDFKTAKEGSETAKYTETKKLYQAQKERIKSLETDLQRLLMSISNDMGDKALLEFFKEHGPEKNPFEYWRSQLNQQNSKMKELQTALEAFQQASLEIQNRQQVLIKESELQSQVLELQEKLKKFEEINGKQVEQVLVEKDLEISRLKDQVDFHEKTQVSLLQEIQNLGKSWTDLEEQNSSKIINLSQLEELKIKHAEERTKLDSKVSILERKLAALENTKLALTKQSNKQMELICALEERDKNYTEQKEAVEKELAGKVVALESEKNLVVLHCNEIEQLKKQLELSNARQSNFPLLLNAKTEQLELEASARKKYQDEVVVLKQKVESFTKDGDANLVEQLNDYKLLLKCSACNNRFKSHVLLKCMHTFCKECLDDMYNSRQRKCPSCSTAFGQFDMKQIFL